MICNCIKCGKHSEDYEQNFWKKNMGFVNKDPYASYCKDCLCDFVDLNNIETFRSICEELNIPFIERNINFLLNNENFKDKKFIIGRYVNTMRLKAYYPFHYADSENFIEKNNDIKYKIIALMGEAGSGKDTILQDVLAAAPNKFHEIISCTTRPPREGEIDGKNYFFLTEEEFLNKVSDKQMLEYTNFNNWYYGTGLDSLSISKSNIGVFNPAGLINLAKNENVELSVFKIDCGEAERLRRQLSREKYPNVEEIIRRYSTDKTDFLEFENTNIDCQGGRVSTFKPAFEFQILPNETIRDRVQAVVTILDKIK